MSIKDATKDPLHAPDIALWGGLEATVNRVRERYFSQMDQNGHAGRIGDLDRFAALGIRALRYPVLWELVAPDGLAHADWSWTDERLAALRELDIAPIAGLVHHGSGPRDTSLVDPGFAAKLAAYAGAVAQRYPWIEYYTPVNEPCTTARFACLYGLWYPHHRNDRSFVRALLHQCQGVALAMRAIRAVNPQAKLVQTDDLGKTYGTPQMAAQTRFYNQRRWLPWDLLCGMVDPGHPLWRYLTDSGATAAELLWFRDHPCPPDIIGVNYYVTSERWLDHRAEHYPASDIGPDGYADIVAARALATPQPGLAPLLQEAWQRYGLPLAVTEAHIDANREDQLRWLLEIWQAAQQARRQGVDMRAVTVWSLLGAFDWNKLVTESNGYYESGAYDVRGPQPRPTALATLTQELATGRPPSSPVLQGLGWWRRPERLLCPPMPAGPVAELAGAGTARAQPVLIAGAGGTLGSAFARLCAERHLACRVLTRQEMDIADPASVEAAIRRHRPWAIVNAGGYVRVQRAELESQRCRRENAQGSAVLATACARHAIALLSFSSGLVFDGSKGSPYVESDPVAPLNVYGRSKAEAERRVLAVHPRALMVRTSALFGPWDRRPSFVSRALQALAAGRPFAAAGDLIVSPTYVPDLVHACLDLLIDGEAGIWHLSNGTALSWAELARRAAALAGVPADGLVASPASDCGLGGHPCVSALDTERGRLLPTLDDALGRFIGGLGEAAEGCYNCAPWPGSSVGRAED